MQQVHNSEILNAKLKLLEKLLKETEIVAKKYVALTSKAKVVPDDDDNTPDNPDGASKGVLQFDEQLYDKLMKVLKEGKNVLEKDDAAIDGCMDRLNDGQKGVNGKRKGKEPASPVTTGKKQKRSAKRQSSPKTSPGASPQLPEEGQSVAQGPTIPHGQGLTGYTIPLGDLVAARQPSSEQWILAKAMAFHPKTQRYEVEDAAPDEEEDPTSKKFLATLSDIIPLPPDPATITPSATPPLSGPVAHLYQPFSAKTSVLAMFPHTTTFYPAKVVSCHKKNKIVQFYQLQFDDDQEGGFTPSRKVAAQYVIPYKA
jgi:hypothetical protein